MGSPESMTAHASINGEDDAQGMVETDRRTGVADADAPGKAGE
jgi:hypothetical protein